MNPFDKIHFSWHPLIKRELSTEAFLTFRNEILPNMLYYPEKLNIFRVFCMPVTDIKVVILGQDPYPTPGDATGLAFAVSENTRIPVSLRNIATEIANNIEIKGESLIHKLEPLQYLSNTEVYTKWRTLEHWQDQGVFLLNTALTVESAKPGSHLAYWEDFTKKVIYFIGYHNPCIWMLWGQKAQRFVANLPTKTIFDVRGYDDKTIKQIPNNSDYNYILRAAHPAAEAYKSNAGFIGCNHFKFANEILSLQGQKSINW